MDSKEILVVGGGLAGLSTAYYLADIGELKVRVIETLDRLGGFFFYDEIFYNGMIGREITSEYIDLVMNNNDIEVFINTSAVSIEGRLYIAGKGTVDGWQGEVVAATGFRSKTPLELGIYGYRPAGVFSIKTVMEILEDGYIPGEEIVIYGLNRYVVSVAYKLSKTSGIKSVKIISPNEERKIMEHISDVEFIRGRIRWIDGLKRVERVILETKEDVKCDTLIIGEVTPFNYLHIKYSVGNASMIVYDPLKIVELSKLFVENFVDILNGGEEIVIADDLQMAPRRISRNIRKVMTAYPKGTMLVINEKEIILDHDYQILRLPDSDEIDIEVIG